MFWGLFLLGEVAFFWRWVNSKVQNGLLCLTKGHDMMIRLRPQIRKLQRRQPCVCEGFKKPRGGDGWRWLEMAWWLACGCQVEEWMYQLLALPKKRWTKHLVKVGVGSFNIQDSEHVYVYCFMVFSTLNAQQPKKTQQNLPFVFFSVRYLLQPERITEALSGSEVR